MTGINSIQGGEAFLSLLKNEGVTHIFGNPGTTELPVMDALSKQSDLPYVLGLQESIVIGMADGFSRASGQLVACNVHVAPGLGNAMGSIYNAAFTNTPMIITAGQQEQGHGLTEPVLYAPLVPIAAPLVKWAIEITRLEDMPRIIRRAAKVAMTPPMGPVFLSLPGDVLSDHAAINLGAQSRVDSKVQPSNVAIAGLAKRIIEAKNPAIISGNEVVISNALDTVSKLAKQIGAAAYQQTIAYGSHFLSRSPTYMGALSRSQKEIKKTLEPYDLLIFLGSTVLQTSVASEVDPMPEGANVVQIGLDDWELAKNYSSEIAIRADVKETVKGLIPEIESHGGVEFLRLAQTRVTELEKANWESKNLKARRAALSKSSALPIEPDWLMLSIVDTLEEGGIIVNESLTSSRALPDLLPYVDRYSFHGNASGGIGWGLPAAVGVKLAHPDRPVTCLSGDGSAMYSIQALWTAAHLNLPITFVITNNRSYRILKQRLLGFHKNERYIGMDFDNPKIDFSGIARSLGVAAETISNPDEVRPALNAASQRSGPTLIDVIVESNVKAMSK